MGCITSSKNTNYNLGNVFKVYSVNEKGQRVSGSAAYLEVTKTDLLYRLRSKQTDEELKWPLKWLRKYGYQDNIFSFEAGHKCQGGEGIFAFFTMHAATLSELVENNIKRGSPPSSQNNRSSNTLEDGSADSKETQGRYTATPTSTPTSTSTRQHKRKLQRSQSMPARHAVLTISPTEEPSHLIGHTPSTPLSKDPPTLTLPQVDPKGLFKRHSSEPQPTQDHHTSEHTSPTSNDTEVEVDGEVDMEDSVFRGEYVNYQGVKSTSSLEPHQATYKNMRFDAPAFSYATLDFARQLDTNADPISPLPRSSTSSASSSVLPLGKDLTNYAKLDIKAMEATAHLRDTKERVTRQRH